MSFSEVGTQNDQAGYQRREFPITGRRAARRQLNPPIARGDDEHAAACRMLIVAALPRGQYFRSHAMQ
jgi:hypothetical protein